MINVDWEQLGALAIVIAFIIVVAVLGIALFHTIFAEKFDYDSCLKYDEEDAGICDMIFPPLRFEAV